jgi:hypothetical protein
MLVAGRNVFLKKRANIDFYSGKVRMKECMLMDWQRGSADFLFNIGSIPVNLERFSLRFGRNL